MAEPNCDVMSNINNLDEIEDCLYLGNLTAAVDLSVLSQHRITHILTVESSALPQYILSLKGINLLQVKVLDMDNEDLLTHFDKTFNFIKDGQENGCVLVHCYFGVSRSATVVASFLMKKYQISLDDALLMIKKKRRCVGPNSGFLAQLIVYQSMNFKLDATYYQYKLYTMQLAARFVIYDPSDGLGDNYGDVVHVDPAVSLVHTDVIAYKCKCCRRPLVPRSAVSPHNSTERPLWSDQRWSHINYTSTTLCKEGLFCFPIVWMKDQLKSLQGKLLCPKCNAKIGSYDWCNGRACPCGAKPNPAIYLISSKVDKCF